MSADDLARIDQYIKEYEKTHAQSGTTEPETILPFKQEKPPTQPKTVTTDTTSPSAQEHTPAEMHISVLFLTLYFCETPHISEQRRMFRKLRKRTEENGSTEIYQERVKSVHKIYLQQKADIL